MTSAVSIFEDVWNERSVGAAVTGSAGDVAQGADEVSGAMPEHADAFGIFLGFATAVLDANSIFKATLGSGESGSRLLDPGFSFPTKTWHISSRFF